MAEPIWKANEHGSVGFGRTGLPEWLTREQKEKLNEAYAEWMNIGEAQGQFPMPNRKEDRTTVAIKAIERIQQLIEGAREELNKVPDSKGANGYLIGLITAKNIIGESIRETPDN